MVTATLTGSNYANTDTIYRTGFDELQAWDVVNPNEIQLGLGFGGNDWSPGWLTFAICENTNDTNCGTSQSVAFLGSRNQCATSASGEIFCIDPTQSASSSTNGYVRKYKSDGTADGSFYSGPAYSIAVDNKTGDVLLDGNDYDENGNDSDVPVPENIPPGMIMAVAAENGYCCFTQPSNNYESSNNSVSCYNLAAASFGGVPVVSALNLGNNPEPIAMGTFGSETDALVVSVNDASSFHLHKVRALDAYAGEEPALALPGTTPESAVVAANITAGGAQVVAFGDPSEWINITATSQANSGVSASELIQFGPASSNIAVSVSPQSVTSQQNLTGWTQQYSAAVSGTTNQQVIWSVNGVVGGNQQFGTISTTGLYQNTAGGEYGDDVVTATSVTDPAKSGIADITYAYTTACENNPTDPSCPVFIGLSPPTASVGPNQTMQFTAIVNDPSDPNPKLIWTVNGITGGNATVGTISATGLYAAPAVKPPSPASGIVAVLSTYDQLLLLVDVNTWSITKSIDLSGFQGTPFRIFADTVNGSVIVAFANPESVTTTYASVDALSGTVTPLTSTSSLLSVGGVVSSDGTKLFLSMRDQMDIQPNN